MSFCIARGEILQSTFLSEIKWQLATNLPSLVRKNVTYFRLLMESYKEADFGKSPGNYVSGHGPQFDSPVGYFEWEYKL
jgi:hypothetical protein